VLTGPAGPSSPQVRSTDNVSGAGLGWAGPGQDRSGPWLRNAAAGLCVLAAAAVAVSFTAQYRMVDRSPGPGHTLRALAVSNSKHSNIRLLTMFRRA
jgi:hypothetical protein